MNTKLGDTVTILAAGEFRKVEVTGATVSNGKTLRIGVFAGTKNVVWFTDADIVKGIRSVAFGRR